MLGFTNLLKTVLDFIETISIAFYRAFSLNKRQKMKVIASE
jgi:hypothetical protein